MISGSKTALKETYNKFGHKFAIQKHEKYLKKNEKVWGLIKLLIESSIRKKTDKYGISKEYYDWIIEFY